MGRDLEATLINLRAGPMQFEGEVTLKAERTPGPEEMKVKTTNGHATDGSNNEGKVPRILVDYNRLNRNGSATVDGSMEVD